MALGGLLLASLITGLIGGGVSALTTHLSNQAQIDEAEKNRQFQLELANSAHQREVEDLKKAGLNPFISANGNGAPVVSGNTASVQPVGDFGLGNISSALQSLAFMQALNSRQNTATVDFKEAAQSFTRKTFKRNRY